MIPAGYPATLQGVPAQRMVSSNAMPSVPTVPMLAPQPSVPLMTRELSGEGPLHVPEPTPRNYQDMHSIPHPPDHGLDSSSLERQLQELLNGQRKMQEDMSRMQNEMNDNYHQCMEETRKLRMDVANGSFATQAGPYSNPPGGGYGGNQYQSYDRDPYGPTYGNPYGQQNQYYDDIPPRPPPKQQSVTFDSNSMKSSQDGRGNSNFRSSKNMKSSKQQANNHLVQKSHNFICC